MKTIRRYKNRKLYDTDLSKYITLRDISVYFSSTTTDFRVLEATTDKDITNVVVFDAVTKNLRGKLNKYDLFYLSSLAGHVR